MKIGKMTKMLLLVSAVAVVFDLARFYIWGVKDLLFLIWNLFLAWIPYFISAHFIKKNISVHRFIPFFILWLLFFPNALYLVTDVFHLVGSAPPFLWYDSLLLFFFGWIGLLLGLLSLFQIHQYLKMRLSYFFSELCIFAICLIASFGVYLGRFERWNSWDIFVNPFHLLKDSFYISANLMARAGNPLLFVIVFTVFSYAVYRTIFVLVAEKTE